MDYISFDLCDVPFSLLTLGVTTIIYPFVMFIIAYRIYSYIFTSSPARNITANIEDNSVGDDAMEDSAADDPLRIQAHRWFKQAELDFRASVHDFDATEPAYEWVCFKCTQVR